MLLTCVCHFSCSSTITPSRRCFQTCSIGVVSNFKGRFFFVGFSAIRFLQHHPEISFKLCCKSLRILSMLSLAVLRVSSSANKLHCTDGRVRHIARSLIKMQNKREPRIDPWDTSLVIDVSWKYVPYASTHCRQPCR